MTKLLEKAIERARGLSDEEQDALALAMLTIAEEPAEPLDDDTRAAIRRGVEEARRGQFASEAEVAALWRRYGL
ncbi:hypothetical protein BH10PSE9_BH10PSE9_20670 [soil metagenome]